MIRARGGRAAARAGPRDDERVRRPLPALNVTAFTSRVGSLRYGAALHSLAMSVPLDAVGRELDGHETYVDASHFLTVSYPNRSIDLPKFLMWLSCFTVLAGPLGDVLCRSLGPKTTTFVPLHGSGGNI
eukprot:COSAG02_NODE_516_length_20804_cov_162.717460_4_plen_129_part_00